jgi:sortase A
VVSTPADDFTQKRSGRLRARRIRKWEGRDRRRSGAAAHSTDSRSRLWGTIAILGRGLIATGLLLFGFVAYQLWGTGIETARAQRALSNEFEQILTATNPDQTPPVTSTPTTAPETSSSQTPSTEPDPVVAPRLLGLGEPLARLEIPRINVDDIVVVGVGSPELQLGPGHFPDTVPPGHLGNSAIAGHRTSYGQPFRNVDRLEPGDEIRATTPEGTFTYRVTQTRIVSPSDYFVVFTTNPDEAQLTLVSCHPVWSTAQRIVVSASLVPEESSPALEPNRYLLRDEATALSEFSPPPDSTVSGPTVSGPTDSGPTTAPSSTETTPAETEEVTSVPPVAEITDAFADGWFHDRESFAQIALWGAVLTLISVSAYGVSVAMRRDLVGFGLGVVPFLIALYFFYQNLQRLVPPGL